MARGFEPLPQYGNTPPPTRDNPQSHTYGAGHYGCYPEDSRELWTPILAHPKGPAEFPSEQVQMFRWYRPEVLPGIMKGRQIRFPQFEKTIRAVGGLKEYRCPDCTDTTYFRPSHLARHLHNSHGYDQAAIIALGQASGIDFNEGLMSLVQAQAIWEVPETDQEQEMSFTPPPVEVPVIVEKVVLPNQSQVRMAQEQIQRQNEDPALLSMIADLKQQIEDLKASMNVLPEKKPLTEAQKAHLQKLHAAQDRKRREREAEAVPA